MTAQVESDCNERVEQTRLSGGGQAMLSSFLQCENLQEAQTCIASKYRTAYKGGHGSHAKTN